jgi:nucleoside-diphosphate-sugar epimerase
MKLKIDLQKNILITGSEGFVGSYFYKKLKKYNNIFYCDLKKIEKKNYFICDVKNKLQLEKLVTENKIKIIVHLASEIFDNSDEKIFNNNIMMGKSIFEIAKRIKLDKILYFSTFSIFEKNYNFAINEKEIPSAVNTYGISKKYVEDLFKKLQKTKIIIFRCPVIIGSDRSHRIGILFELIRMNMPIFLPNFGNSKFEFCSLEKIFLNTILLLKSNYKYEIYNIGCKKNHSIKQIIEYTINKSKSKTKIYNLKTLYFLIRFLSKCKLIDINTYHLDLLKSNIILDKSKILREGARLDESDILIFYRTYKNYLKNKEQNKLNTIGSNQRPKLKILKILILVILLKNICSFINKKFTKNII